MDTKKAYSRARPPEEGARGGKTRYALWSTAGRKHLGDRGECTCWVLLRGEGPGNVDRSTVDCELVPDPACPVHSRKRYPLLDDDWED